MIILNEKDKESIIDNLKEKINGILLSNFKNRRGRKVDSVENISIIEWKIDEENSNRDTLIISRITIEARVWVKLDEDSRSNDDVQLQNSNPIEFIYDENMKEFKLAKEKVEFFDKSTY